MSTVIKLDVNEQEAALGKIKEKQETLSGASDMSGITEPNACESRVQMYFKALLSLMELQKQYDELIVTDYDQLRLQYKDTTELDKNLGGSR